MKKIENCDEMFKRFQTLINGLIYNFGVGHKPNSKLFQQG